MPAPLFKSSPFHSRLSFGRFLNNLRLVDGIGVEIGTHRGNYAEHLLATWACKVLYCVDPWVNPPGYEDQSVFLWGDGNRDHDFAVAKSRLVPFKERVRFLRMTSEKATDHIQDGSLDFVYVDGDHSYAAVRFDLEAWLPKLKSGGILAGHDIVCPGIARADDWGRFIQPAVIDFATTFNIPEINLVCEDADLPWSYWMRPNHDTGRTN